MENKMVKKETKNLYEEFIGILEETMILIEKKRQQQIFYMKGKFYDWRWKDF